MIGLGNIFNAFQLYKDILLIKKFLVLKSIGELKNDSKVAVCGKIISADNQPIISPFLHQSVVFFNYSIYQFNGQSNSNDYYGCSLTPSVIQSNVGNIAIKSFPVLEGFKENEISFSTLPATQQIYANAVTFIQQTKFEINRSSDVLNIYKLGKGLLKDRDGYINQNVQYSETAFDMRTRSLSESYILNGDEVCVFGIWKADQQGITSDYNRTTLRIVRGTPNVAIENIKKQLIKSLFTGLIFLGAIHLLLFGGMFISSAVKLQNNYQNSNGSANYIVPTTVITPTNSPNLTTYQNSVGNYSYQYPSNWINTERINRDPNIPEQPIVSVDSFVKNPIYAPMYGSLDIHYDINDPDCTYSKSADISNYSKGNVVINGTNYETYSKSALNTATNRIIYSEDVFIPKANRCYVISVLDQEHRPYRESLQAILDSFLFLDDQSLPSAPATPSAAPAR